MHFSDVENHHFLSILIPTYRYCCAPLVESLNKQCAEVGIDYEIVVADDGSCWKTGADPNAAIAEMPHCRYIVRQENVGRSRIRNFLMTEAKGDLLLLMDQDGSVIRTDFIAKYLDAARQADVVCGGIIHSDNLPPRNCRLRYRYEKRYEHLATPERLNAEPARKFRSFSFLIHRRVAESVTMDERYDAYGYEDVQYGRQLRQAGFSILHIDNPLRNDDIEENPRFLHKTEEALRTLHRFRTELADDATLLFTVHRLQRLHVAGLLAFAGRLLMPVLRLNLQSTWAIPQLFNPYKLFYYLNIE